MGITGNAWRATPYRGVVWLAVFCAAGPCVLLGCGGKAESSGHSSAGAASSDDADASGSAGAPAACPQAEPEDGNSCPSPGAVCNGFGSLSCPDVASCTSEGKWRVTCPAMPLGYPDVPACPCAHPVSG